jgi:hypothetical protein
MSDAMDAPASRGTLRILANRAVQTPQGLPVSYLHAYCTVNGLTRPSASG